MIMAGMYMVSSYATAWYTLQTKAELEKLCALFLYAQQCARTSGAPIEIVFDQTKKSYSCGIYCETLPRHVVFGASPECKGPPSAPEKPITDAITFEKKRAMCYPDGTIQSGTVYMLDTKNNISYAITVPIGHVTYLKRYEFGNHRWNVLP